MNEVLRLLLFLPDQASSFARTVDQLHYAVIGASLFGAVVVTIVGGYLVLRNRRSVALRRPRGEPPVHISIWVEMATIVALFVLFVGFWVVGVRHYNVLRVAPEGALSVYVTGKQWMWKFAYENGARSIATLYVPVGQPVELRLTSRDVIHSFFVPAFRIKQDAVPGRYTTAWFQVEKAGRYEVFCTEYCGLSHSTMRGEIVALSPSDFARWVEGALPEAGVLGPVYSPPSVVGESDPSEMLGLVRQGELTAARRGCLRCHSLDGSRHIGPSFAGLFGSKVPLEGGSEVVADAAYLTRSMMTPLADVHRGYAPVMPSYRGVLDAEEVAVLVQLIGSLRDRVVGPADDVLPLLEAPAPARVDGAPRVPMEKTR